MNRPTRRSWLLSVVFVALATGTQKAEAQMVFPTKEPQMVGHADAPKSIKKMANGAYVISQTDQDVNLQRQLVIDTTCAVRPIKVMAGVFTASLRGVDLKGEFTWDITGMTYSNAGTFREEWELYNNRGTGPDPLRDLPITVTQVVYVTD